MGDPTPGTQITDTAPDSRLDSWKEIAAYLSRDVTTVQRWEKREGMPVHRHLHEKRGSVYALTSELDEWRGSRKPRLEGNGGPRAQDEAALAETAIAEPFPHRAGVERYRWIAAVTVMALAVASVAFGILKRPRNAAVPSRAAAPATTGRIRSLAVLPLKNMTGDPGQEYLADSLTDALIGRLAGIHDLKVISRTSVMRFKNPQISAPEIAQILGVDAIVEGSVMRDGNRIRVTAQLIRAATDEHFWSETYDRELKDVFSLESDLAQTIAAKVEVTVTGAERERLAASRAVAPEVYESYSKGEFALNQSHSKEGLEKSIGYFQRAIDTDATFAPAYVGLGDAYGNLGTVFIGGVADETRPKVVNAAHRALQLDPNLAEAHVQLADVLREEWHWQDAEEEYKRALELNPNSAAAYEGLGLWLACQGRSDEAVASAERGRELDPLAVSFEDFGWTLFQTRHYEQGARELRAALVDRPDDFGTLMDLGFVLLADDHADQAVPVLEKAAELSHRSPAALAILARAYAHSGRRGDALRLVAELEARSRKGYVPAGAMVNAYLGMGETEQAFHWLAKAYQEQSNMLQFVKVHPFFDPIRKDPRFTELVRRGRINLGELGALWAWQPQARAVPFGG